MDENRINDKFSRMTMWGHWRSSLSAWMILWIIMKFSAPVVVTWSWLFYPLGFITIVFMVVGIVRKLCK